MVRSAHLLALAVLLGLLTSCGIAAPGAAGSAAEEARSSERGDPGTAHSALPAGTEVESSGGATAPRAAGPTELTVFAAASLTGPFTELGRQFEVDNNVKLRFNFAGSQQLAQQIKEGAPANVFAAAHRRHMDAVIDAGRVRRGTEQIFAGNRLVVIYPKDNPADLSQLQDLAKPQVKLVIAAKAVPVGEYTLEFLAKASALPQYTAAYNKNVLRNVVSYEENVKAVQTKVVLGEADAGIVYSSDVTPDVADRLGRIEIPDELNVLATYPVAAINDSANDQLADLFIAYLLSPEGQAVLFRYGFITDGIDEQSGTRGVGQP